MRKILASRHWLVHLVAVLSGGLLLALPTLLNGLPFLYIDSGFYILHSALKVTSWSLLWRPLSYSLFLKAILSAGNLILFVLVQNFVISGILYVAARRYAPSIGAKKFLILISALFLTPLPLYSCFVMPDVFSGIAVLGFATFLSVETARQKLAWMGVTILSAITHYSNLLVGNALILLALAAGRFRNQMRYAIPVLLLPWILVPSIHAYVTGRFTVSNVVHVYVFSQLTALGVAQEHLKGMCAKEPSPLCDPGHQFHIWNWGAESLVGKAGGLHRLIPEIKRVNFAILSGPLAFSAVYKVLNRVGTVAIGYSAPLIPTVKDAHLESELTMYSLDAVQTFRSQRIQELPLERLASGLNYLYWITGLSSLLVLVILFARGRLSAEVRILFVCSIAGYLLNALVCGALTDPLPRYSGRMVWLFGFALALHLLNQGSKSSTKRLV